MNEKDKAMQEENKEAMDGVMSDDELDAVGGGLNDLQAVCDNTLRVGCDMGIDPLDCCNCLDGLSSSHRIYTDGKEVKTATEVESW